MSVTSGFFNSLNHDRRYNAQQMSAIFDGIINDGVFANIGVAFAINADTGVTITIGKGKAWFNSAWVYNDALLPKTLEGSEVVLDRIDAVVIEVDHNEAVRMGDIKIVKGTPSSSPQRPAMVDTEKKSQHPLGYIYRKAGSTEITQADITNMVGTSECPYITGILQVQNIDNIVAQWNAQWNQWYAEKVSQTDSDASVLLAEMKSDFDIWFADVKALLEDDAATALAAEVAELQGKFDDLARDGAVYDTIEDSALDAILGSDGTPIQGKTVFGAGGPGSADITPESIGALAVIGGKMLGDIDMNGHKLHGFDEPVDPDEPATKGYSDSQITDRVIYGKGKNLLKNTVKSKTVNGVTFTVNDDGSVTVNGTATGSAARLWYIDSGKETKIDYLGAILSGGSKKVNIYVQGSAEINYIPLAINSGGDSVISDGNTGYNPFLAGHYRIFIDVAVGVTVNNETVYPMIRIASETDDTYEPYYKGLVELTDRGIELLWENASPTSAFPQQEISIPTLSNYKTITIETDRGTFIKNTTSGYLYMTGAVSWSTGDSTLTYRAAEIKNNGIVFMDGYVRTLHDNKLQVSNNEYIPVKIYGIKGVSA